MEEESHPREQWNTRIGFILAAIGSAVGLGNIWRFPYLTYESGGASFVVLYLILLFFIGIPVMIAEFVIGRGSKRSPVQALSINKDHNWSFLGYLFVLTGFWILAYYSVVAGWTIRYIIDSFGGSLMTMAPGDYFSQVKAGTPALLSHLSFMAITTGIVLAGVEEGIERTVKVLIPVLVFLLVGLAVWAFFQPGSYTGYAFYLAPEPSKLFDLNRLADAAGQTFFTLSLGMGAMITYASYLGRRDDLAQETIIISFSNVGISILAGLTVFPIIYSFGLQSQIGESTVATLFIAIPKAFQSIGGFWGGILSLAFFLSLFLAALTSAISLLEVVTSSLIDEIGISRPIAASGSGFLIFLVGVVPAYSTEYLSLMDKIANNLLLVTGGFFLAVYAGWIMKDSLSELRQGLTRNVDNLWYNVIRFVVPPVLFALLLNGVVQLIG